MQMKACFNAIICISLIRFFFTVVTLYSDLSTKKSFQKFVMYTCTLYNSYWGVLCCGLGYYTAGTLCVTFVNSFDKCPRQINAYVMTRRCIYGRLRQTHPNLSSMCVRHRATSCYLDPMHMMSQTEGCPRSEAEEGRLWGTGFESHSDPTWSCGVSLKLLSGVFPPAATIIIPFIIIPFIILLSYNATGDF